MAINKTHARNKDKFLDKGGPDELTATETRAFIDSKGQANGLASLTSNGKVPTSELPASVVGSLAFKGTWNANTNTPTLGDSGAGGSQGDYYVVDTIGTTSIDGNNDWQIGDWLAHNGSTWDKIDNSDKVASVNGSAGVVVLDTDDITEAANLYYTEIRVSANTDVAANTGARHSHSNKALLDTYTQTEVDLADAVSKKHTQNSDISLDNGQPNQVTSAELRTHLDDVTKHRLINDLGVAITDLWSADKITTELSGKAAFSHTHVAADVTDFDTEVSTNTDVAANTAARNNATTIQGKAIDAPLAGDDGKAVTYDLTLDKYVYTSLPGGGGSTIYAQLNSSIDQVPTDTNPTVVTYNTQDAINGITHSTTVNPGEITIDTAGIYVISPQPQVSKDSGNQKIDFDMFIQVDRGAGFVDEPNSNIKLTIKDSDITDVIVLTFTISLDIGDKIRMMQRVNDSSVGMGLKNTDPVVGPPTVPRTPSIIMAIHRVGAQ